MFTENIAHVITLHSTSKWNTVEMIPHSPHCTDEPMENKGGIRIGTIYIINSCSSQKLMCCTHLYHSHSSGPYHDDVIKWKHFPRYWPFVRGIHRSPVNSPHKGQWRGALMFTLICARINGWINNREAGHLRRHRTHYDVIVMCYASDIRSGRLALRLSLGWLITRIKNGM